MPFGEKNEQLIPYKVDEQGMVLGATTYSSEVSEYERAWRIVLRFQSQMKRILREEVSRLYRKETIEGFGILAIGLAAFGLLIWAIGRIVRGFLGIPRGMDKRPN